MQCRSRRRNVKEWTWNATSPTRRFITAQLPLFRALGTKPEEKQHVVLEGGHLPPRPQGVFKEILN